MDEHLWELRNANVIGCRVIHTFMPKILENFRFSSGSTVGRGGMEAKVASAWDAAQAGVTTVIANGKLPSVLLRVSVSCFLGLPLHKCRLQV